MSNLQTLKFFCTPAHRCSYLPDRQAVTLFLDPKTEISNEVYASLTTAGFRRSGDFVYRPHCGTCHACIPVRIVCNRFTPDRAQRRCIRQNADLTVLSCPARYTPEYYQLYERYIETRHQDGDMFPPTRNQFRSFLLCSWANSRFYEFRDPEGHLLAVSVVDHIKDGMSAVYTFYDPDEEARSLGRYAILWQVREACKRGMGYVYLGYWIRQCRKMSYKREYQPLEYFDGQYWLTPDPEGYRPAEAVLKGGIFG